MKWLAPVPLLLVLAFTLDDGTFYAEVPSLRGVLATGRTLEACREELGEVVEEWVLVRVAQGLGVPPLRNVIVRVKKAG